MIKPTLQVCFVFQCSVSNGISWESLKSCYDSGEAANLLAQNGDLTKPIIEESFFVPSIVFNGRYNQSLQNGAIRNLKNLVSNLLKFEK